MHSTTQTGRFGVTIQGIDPPAEFQQQVRDIEDRGFTHLWVTDSSLHARYVYAYLTLAALNSSRLILGTGITHPYTRHPAITVNAIATLDEISQGRALLGLGSGDRPTAELGFSPARMQVLREMIDVTRRLMAGEQVDHEGSTFRLHGAQVHYKYRDSVPIYLACSGPKMLSLAGEIADGVIVQCGLFPEAIDYAREKIAEGAAKAGRSLDQIDIWTMACGKLDPDRDKALESSRTMAAWFAQTAPHCCKLAGIDPKLIERIQKAYGGGEFHLARDAARLVPDEMVQLFTLAGTPEEARSRIQALGKDGNRTSFNFMPIGPERTRSAALFAQHVIGPLATSGNAS